MIERDFEFRSESREDTDGDGHSISGYAAVFDQDTEINSYEGKFTERISKGAFRKTLKDRAGKIIMQYDHGRDTRVGSVPIGKYTTIREDDHGLYTEGRLFTNSLVEPVRQAIEGGAISGQSFKFQVVKDEWRDKDGKLLKGDKLRKMLWDGAEGLVRTIKEVKLFEAGPVSTPAYGGTSVGVRNAEEVPEPDRDALFEEYQRTMIEPEEAEFRNADRDADIAVWLREEALFRWLEAEEEFRKSNPFPPKKKGEEEDDDEEDPKSKKKSPFPPKKKEGEEDEKDDEDEEEDDEESDPKSKKKPAAKKAGAAEKGTPEKKRGTPDTEAVRQDTPRRDSEITKPVERKRSMTLTELRELLADANLRAKAIEDNEEYRSAEMPEEVRKAYDEAKAEITATEARIKGIEEWMAKVGSSKNVDAPKTKDQPAVRKAENLYDLDEIRGLAYNDQDRVKLVREHAQRAIDEGNFGGTSYVDEADAQKSALNTLKRYDGQDNAIAKRMLTTGSETYQRAWAKAAASGNPAMLFGEEARALSLGADGSGGYAVPFQLDPTVIWTDLGIQDPIRANARVERITGKEFHGVFGSAASVSRADEAAQAADNSFALTNYTVRTSRVQGFIPFSYELAESWDRLQAEITYALAYAKTEEEANSFMLGDTSLTNAAEDVEGLVSHLSGNTVDVATDDTFAVGDVYALEGALDVRYRANAKFLAHHATYNNIRQFGTTDGHALWERIGNGQPNSLLGYPALESSVVAGTAANWSPWTKGQVAVDAHKFMLFGDFKNFLIVDRIGMSTELIPQIFGANQRPTGQRGVYAIWMNNTKILVDAAFKVLKNQTT